MTPRSNVEWKFWGKQDPLWAVAAWNGRSKGGENPWKDEEFYELGRKDWSDFIKHWEKYGVADDTAVEIGCGAGRLTRYMATYFRKVYALDVSEDMISYAARHISSSNVVFITTNGSVIPVEDHSATAAFSTHVFQHLESTDDASTYFREIFRVLVPGGTMMIHLPVYAWPWGAGKWVRRVYRLYKLAEDYRAKSKRHTLERGGSVSLMRMHSYAVRDLYTLLPGLGFEDIEIHIFVTRSNNDPHPFVLARKPRA